MAHFQCIFDGLIETKPEELLDLCCSVFEHGFSQPRIHTDPERVIHHYVRIAQVAGDTEVAPCHIRLAHEVTREQQTCANLVLIEVSEQI